MTILAVHLATKGEGVFHETAKKGEISKMACHVFG